MNKSTESILLSLVILSPYLIQLCTSAFFVPGPDEALQLQAAHQLFLGNGYVSARGAWVNDLAQVRLAWVTAWPIGYSFVLYLLQLAGISLLGAAKLFAIATIALAVWGWSLVLKEAPLSSAQRRLFLFLLWPQFLTWGVYSCGALSWALFPLLLWCALTLERSRSRVWCLGAVSALFVLFRYQNIILIPAGVAALFFQQKGPWKARIKACVQYAIFPSVVFLGIFGLNKLHANESNLLSSFPVAPGWKFRWLPDFANAFLFNATYRIDDAALSVFRKLHLEAAFPAAKLALSSGLLIALAATYRKRRNKGREMSVVELWSASYLACLLALLFSIAIMYQIENVPIGRYYHSVIPLFLLLLISVVNVESFPGWKAVLSAMLLASFGVSAGFSLHRAALSRDFERKIAVAERALADALAAGAGEAPPVILADQMFSHFSIQPEVTALTEAAFLDGELRASKPALLFLAADPGNAKPEFAYMGESLKRAATRFGLSEKREDDQVFAWKVIKPSL